MKICDDLRQAVLQAAIQGKLTTQRPEDGDARELLKQIQEKLVIKKAKIEIIDVSKIESKAIEFETINISVNSLRLDNIISEILKTSRKIAQEQIEQEKIFINYTAETKSTKNLKENDILVIRGKGKYIIEKFLGKNKKRKGNNTNKKICMI